jgi:hypothetical protein
MMPFPTPLMTPYFQTAKRYQQISHIETRIEDFGVEGGAYRYLQSQGCTSSWWLEESEKNVLCIETSTAGSGTVPVYNQSTRRKNNKNNELRS